MLRRISASLDRVSAGLVLSLCLLALPLLAGPAQARPSSAWDAGKYAAIVVDMNTERVLFARNADAARYPASLTKMMTLYLLFEELKSGRMSLSTQMSVSAHAAGQAPSKLGLSAGSTITVRTAILALITRSANDVAAVIAENIAGSHGNFAARMTRKARALGMAGTTFRNASGLPDAAQRTTARDMAKLAQALIDDFPEYFDYFKTRSFTYQGRYHGNHNRLLGRVEGVEGIKTGYIRASGFNLATSARRGGRHLVAVVMGGPSGAARDAHMADILDRHFPVAATQKTTRVANVRLPDIAPLPPRYPGSGSDQPFAAAAAAPLPMPRPTVKPQVLDPQPAEAGSTGPEADAAEPAPLAVATAKPHVVGDKGDPIGTLLATGTLAHSDPDQQLTVLTASPPPPPAPVEPDRTITALIAERLREPTWLIQIGAYNDEQAARERLQAAKSEADMLRSYPAYTEPVARNAVTLYRARFAGFDRSSAEAACRALKKAKFGCLAMQQ